MKIMSENQTALKIENIKKKYVIKHVTKKPDDKKERAKLALYNLTHPKQANQKEDFWALNGVNFEVKQGEKVGIIGKNGAGKSTLLKVISRITEPTDGRIEFYGKISSMLEVGTGFNRELTGRENIYLNGAILGMTRAEIDAKFDDILEFSEVGKFIDTPVKRYSSGMFVRLAFAVASHLDPDI
ncbi:MAG: ABC transporter ATP-binding protein, partial [Acutalibacteraceae bacterium]|nr:ABC transporter ATP-binding protein [Acutalibacteraceae bacterium]